MSNYQKIWGTVFVIMIIVFFGLLIFDGTTSENSESILKTLNNPNTKRVSDIIIAPENPEWNINLTVDTLRVKDENKVNDIILKLKKLTEKNLTKGAKTFWESTLIINFDKSYDAKLKDKKKLTFKVFDTDEGLFIEFTNTMGYKTYSCQELKPLLESLANYQKPLGGQN